MKNVKTVAQSLRRIKELKGQLAQTDRRMSESVCWVEPGTKPTYDYNTLAEERGRIVEELVSLKSRLALTNATTPVAADCKTMTLQAAVFTMAELKAERNMLSLLHIEEDEFKMPSGSYDERGRPVFDEKRHVTALSVLKRDEAMTVLEKRIAEINEAVEDVNHRTTLLA